VESGIQNSDPSRTKSRELRIQHSGPRSQTLVVVRPEGLPANLLLAKQAIEQGRPDEARALLDEATLGQVRQWICRDPSRVDVMAMVGLMLLRVRHLEGAEYWFRELVRHSRDPWGLRQLAEVLRLTGRFSQAADLNRQVLDMVPDDVEAQVTYGLDMIREGLLEEGLSQLQRVVEANPTHAEAHAKWLFHMHYAPDCDREWLADQYRQWGQRHMPMDLARTSHDRDLDPHRRLRVGLLSGDLRSHSAAYGLELILEHYDRDQIQLYAYSNVPCPDAVTARLKAHFEAYRDIRGMDDQSAADMIEQDRIDILMAVAGHTDHHRLGVVALRPAPLQADYQGINTTGMAQVDYRFADVWLDPSASQSLYVEQSVYLSGGLLCYRPPEKAGEPTPPPVQANGFVTFGSFNNAMKINPYLIALWTEVLKATPGSRLLLKFAGGDEPRIRDRFLGRFEQAGLSASRVEIIGWRSPSRHLEMYNCVDIALDTYPFNGAMTTLEGLWMGVPTVTLLGERYISRVGMDILSQVGLGSLVAYSPQEYVAKATALTRNGPALAKIHSSLRRAMATSPLCDGKSHAQALEQALRQMWQRWCDGQMKNQKSTIKNEALPLNPDALEFFIGENKALKFTLSKKGLPGFLFEAASAIKVGAVDRAKAILTEPAIDEVRRIAREDPVFADAAFLLAVLLSKTEQLERAEPWYQKVAQRRSHPMVYFELANLARAQGRWSQAVAYQRQAVDLAPQSPELSVVLADYLIRAGSAPQGIEILRRIVDAALDRTTHSKVLWHLHQAQTLDQTSLFKEHRRWAELHAPLRLARTSHDHDPDPDRRLRVGYISPDFCGHSVAYFFESLLDGHDPHHVETFGYGHVTHQDVVTERLQGKFGHYRNICGTDDQAVVRQIEQDRIDVLVDLAGHTGDNRLAVLACKPAPVQVSFLGYPDTTGMEQIDYRFTDVWADLPEAQRFYTEELIRLPSGFICYRPPGFAPAVGLLPALKNGFLTFGSFNNNGKINAHVLDLWAQVLYCLPTSRLLLKFEGGDDGEVRQHYLDELVQRGVDASRVQIVGRRSVLEHLDLYNQVDIGLDTFPYHGTTTTCEAMWMGVPTVTLVGEHHASRVGLSLLTRVGLEVFAAATDHDYVSKAVAFAREPDNLVVIRRSLRNMMQASPLCDAKAYTRDVEAAYRTMWRAWCDSPIRNQKSKIKKEEVQTRINSSLGTPYSAWLEQGGPHGR